MLSIRRSMHTARIFLKEFPMAQFRTLPALVVLFLAAPAWAQDVASGPDKGKAAPALAVFDATGPHKDKNVDYAKDRKGKATVYLLIQAEKFDRPMARFMKVLDQSIQKADIGGFVVAVWLTDDNDKTKNYLPLAQQSLKFDST